MTPAERVLQTLAEEYEQRRYALEDADRWHEAGTYGIAAEELRGALFDLNPAPGVAPILAGAFDRDGNRWRRPELP